ncbi:hypothetical protein WMO79_01430 [Micrococcaceae bacterium Sec7.4]
MAVNEQNQDRRKNLPIDRVSSQAGLNAFAGGRANTLASVPSPGQPGSRFNAVVVDRGERMGREEGVKAPKVKSLPLNAPPGMIQGIPPAFMNQTGDKESEQTVAGAAAQGFTGGFIAGAQNRMFGSSGGGEQDGANPSWQENNREAVALNTRIMASTAESIALMDRNIAAMNHPSDAAARAEVIAARAKALESFRAMQVSMAHDQVNVDVQAGAQTDADVEARRRILGELQGSNGQMRTNLQQRGGADLAKSGRQKAPVRNADGKSLADLTAAAPGEDPLPGTTQPLVMDVIDAARGKAPGRPAKGGTRGVVMNPAHVAGLQSLDNGHEDSLESAGSHFGR